jgi:transposase
MSLRWPRGTMWNKIRQLEEALDGADTFTDHRAMVLKMMLGNIDHLTAQVAELTTQIEELIAPFDRHVDHSTASPDSAASPPTTCSPRSAPT